MDNLKTDAGNLFQFLNRSAYQKFQHFADSFFMGRQRQCQVFPANIIMMRKCRNFAADPLNLAESKNVFCIVHIKKFIFQRCATHVADQYFHGLAPFRSCSFSDRADILK
ncbi:hypothetical protein SDC9_144382 [bioreactor metagenome]|uniref:Uncharacterized protein n=1 Tax=bioreactor metagenome TaxID=1076179 RepID=A0A645E6P3_9ZZZZ